MRNLLNLNIFSLLLLPLSSFAAEVPSDLRDEVDKLKKQNQIILERLDATTEQLEKTHRQANSASHFGGYGEMHYNNLENKKSSGVDKDELDFHRFVLFFGHDFSDRIRFFSELELEHALVKDTSNASGPGEVELEQAYVQFDIGDNQYATAGLFLVPVGIINETHEPPTFYGVERNPVETNILPTTWWEGGALYNWRFGNGVSVDIAMHSGLKAASSSNYAIRSGRQKVAKAIASNAAYTARVKWTGVAGLEVATTLQHQTDITQSTDATAGAANLIETHAAWQQGPFQVRALYATWDLDGSGPAAIGANKQKGWYVEPAYRFHSTLGFFARYNTWDNRVSDVTDSEYEQVDVGINYWPHPNVVIKLDYQDQYAPSGADEFDGLNIGIGYQF